MRTRAGECKQEGEQAGPEIPLEEVRDDTEQIVNMPPSATPPDVRRGEVPTLPGLVRTAAVLFSQWFEGSHLSPQISLLIKKKKNRHLHRQSLSVTISKLGEPAVLSPTGL